MPAAAAALELSYTVDCICSKNWSIFIKSFLVLKFGNGRAYWC